MREREGQDLQYRRAQYKKWGGTKNFSTPPYSPHGLTDFLAWSSGRDLRQIRMAPTWRFLKFHLEPLKSPPFNPHPPTPRMPKNQKIFFFEIWFFFNGIVWHNVWIDGKSHFSRLIYHFSLCDLLLLSKGNNWHQNKSASNRNFFVGKLWFELSLPHVIPQKSLLVAI